MIYYEERMQILCDKLHLKNTDEAFKVYQECLYGDPEDCILRVIDWLDERGIRLYKREDVEC